MGKSAQKMAMQTPMLSIDELSNKPEDQDVADVQEGPVPWASRIISTLFLPLNLIAGWVMVRPNEVVAVSHLGTVTSVHRMAGCFKVPCFGMEQRHVSVKEQSLELHPTKVVDAVGAPVMVAAVINYAPEIAAAMLKKQQAGALIEARALIVEGAVRIAKDAVQRLEKEEVVKMSDQDKVKVVTNLLTVTCGDVEATPTVQL